jgi:hypothetical protein
VDFYSYSSGRFNCSRVSFLIEMSISIGIILGVSTEHRAFLIVFGTSFQCWAYVHCFGGVFKLYLAFFQLLGVCTVLWGRF